MPIFGCSHMDQFLFKTSAEASAGLSDTTQVYVSEAFAGPVDDGMTGETKWLWYTLSNCTDIYIYIRINHRYKDRIIIYIYVV